MMKDKFQVKILRLKSGDDIIGFCYEDFNSNQYVIKYVKVINIHYDEETLDEEYYLTDFMNNNIFAYPQVRLSANDVLFSNYATVYFGALYLEELLEDPELEEELVEGIKYTLGNISDSIDDSISNEKKEKTTLH